MNNKDQKLELWDNGGRRLGFDRRQVSYTLCVPERRNGIDRRSGKDRRKQPRYLRLESN